MRRARRGLAPVAIPAWAMAAPLWAIAAGCGDPPVQPLEADPFLPAADDTVPYVYKVPEQTGDGWEVASLSEVVLSETVLTRMIDVIREGTYHGVHGIVIVRDGKLVLEEYFNGIDFKAAVGDSIVGPWTQFDRNTPHNLASTTKSITSTLLGIAITRGLVTSVDTAVYDFFPDHANLRDARKDSIRLRDMLTMTSGLKWDESTYSYGDPRNDINALFSQNDPIAYILAKPVVASRGTQWLYNGGNTNVLGEVVRRASGMSVDAFADAFLFGPLGITDRSWVHLAHGVTYASGDLRLRPRDMAKIGWMLADSGRWAGQQIVSPEWIGEATAWRVGTRDTGWGYGYQWWLYDFEVDGVVYPSYSAHGWGGQIIAVFPEQRLVVAETGGNYYSSDPSAAILTEFVLRALEP